MKAHNLKGFTFLLSIFCALGILVVLRLVQLQLVDGSWYQELANRNRSFTDFVLADRGVFLDRYGQPLTLNQPAYYQILDPSQLYPLKEPIDREQALELMTNDPDSVSYSSQRVVNSPFSMAHVLGYIGPVSAEELKNSSQNLTLESWTGKLGLEKIYDEKLRGTAGSKEYEVNARGEKLHVITENQPIAGINIQTTLDPELSDVAYRAMGENSGAVVILDATNGEVLSMVSAPSFDATLMSQRYVDPQQEASRKKQVAEFINNPNKLFFNRAIAGTYAPGSVFKLVTALAGLESNSLDSETTVVDEGTLEVGDEYSYANWYYTQFGGVEGEIGLQRAISRSNDIFFYKAAEWIGPEKLAEFARLFGLGAKTEVGLLGEAAGLVPDPTWKETTLGERWFLGNTYHFGIGQDNLLVTPVQVAKLFQAVGNQGVLCKPSLIKSDKPSDCAETGVSQEHLDLLLKGMLDACSAGGTAFPFFDHNEDYRQPDQDAMQEINNGAVACKTGTAEFGPQDERGFRKTHGWFGAIVGTKNIALNRDFPERIVVIALVESDETTPYKEGSTHAAPVVKQIIDWILTGEEPVSPDSSPDPDSGNETDTEALSE